MTDEPRAEDGSKSDKAVLREVLEPELRRVYERIEANNENTSNVVQYIILVFGVVLVAASQRPAAFAFVPIFWTVWMLHSRVIDFNTLKLSLYGAQLERRLNSCLPEPVFYWESRFTQRGNEHPFIFNLNFGYWGALNGAAWVGGIAVLIYDGLNVWSTMLTCLWVALWAPFLRDVRARDEVMAALKDELAKGAAASTRPIAVPSDSVEAHLPLLAGSAVVIALSGAISVWTDDPWTTRATITLNVVVVLCLTLLDFAQPGPGRIVGSRDSASGPSSQ
jgi:hypothetical protein